jgi:exoribonuclease R
VLHFQGHFVRALGKIGDKDTENEVLLLEHDVPHSKFSEAVLSCLPKLPWVITDKVSGIFFFFLSSVRTYGLLRC